MRKELLRRIKGLTVLLMTMILLWTTFGMDVLAAETGYVIVFQYAANIPNTSLYPGLYTIFQGDASKFDNITPNTSSYGTTKSNVINAGFSAIQGCDDIEKANGVITLPSGENLAGKVYVIQTSGGVKYYENGVPISTGAYDSFAKKYSNLSKIELTLVEEGSTVYRADITSSIPVTAITVKSEGGASEINIGKELQLTTVKTPEDAEDPEIEWSSSDESIAKVDNNGKVTGIAAGKVTITAKVKNSSPEITGTFQVTVLPDDPVSPDPAPEDTGFYSGLKISQKKGNIKVSWDKYQGAARFEVFATYCGTEYPSKPNKKTTSNSVTIKKIKGKKLDLAKNFKVYVVAYDSSGKNIGKTVSSHFAGKNNKTYKNPKEVKLATKALTLNKGQSSKISASVKMEAGKKKALGDDHTAKLRYQSTNKNIATVDSKGNVTAVGSGECKIYVFARNGLAKAVTVTVN
ncbi:Ig-like domain-containing protein [Butyrivibrio sp. MB2005]|uniref:Ig-like domain-containing protein n=1 Tax=Butyrivibrio sp. MB2005 TaxID=1280678 RepID=UPI00047D4D05|nr:Ig-like domain-containing protein [Butyrivibrio sp. MB2005]